MLSEKQLNQHHNRHMRLWLQRRSDDLLNDAAATAMQHPEEDVLVINYAYLAIEQRAPRHYQRALHLLLNTPEESVGDILRAKLFQLSDQLDHAIEVLTDFPNVPEGHVDATTYAAWLACEDGQPERAPSLEPTNLMAAITQLRVAGMLDDRKAGGRAMNAILDLFPESPLQADWPIGRERTNIMACTPSQWMLVAAQAWCGRLTWLAPQRSLEFAAFTQRLGLPNSSPALPLAEQVKADLEAGRIVEATRRYQELVNLCHCNRYPIPCGWRTSAIGQIDEDQIEPALEVCQDLLLSEQVDAASLLPWYHAVWYPLIETQSAKYRAGIHRAVMCRTQSSRARFASARALVDAGQFGRAKYFAWPLLQRACWSNAARELIDRCYAAQRRTVMKTLPATLTDG